MKICHTTAFRQMKPALLKSKVLELVGPKGSGKTTFVLDYFSEKPYFYFSFAGLEERMARHLLGDRLTQELNCAVVPETWDEIFSALNQVAVRTRTFIFDHLDSFASDRTFCSALQKYIDDPNRRYVFLVLVHTDTVLMNLLSLQSRRIELPYCTVAAIKKTCPKWTGQDILEIYTLSGGIPVIVNSFAEGEPIEESVRRLLTEDSPFLTFAEEVLSARFRRPESYAMLLHAISTGHGSVSELGKFSGYPYNKCDKYLKALMAAGLVKAVKQKTESGAEKTSYQIGNPYFRIWFRSVYPNQTIIAEGGFAAYFISTLLPEIRETDVEREYTAACFRALKHRVDGQVPASLRSAVANSPLTVKDADFSYTFDFAGKTKNTAVFVKIFHDDSSAVGRAQLDALERAVNLFHLYADSQIYLFSKRRFSDALIKEATFGVVKLFTVDRLRF
ncbi:MAG: ATP-binding protein [Lawsonibacter sp.]|nr:ATP-binding protein [Lawsonibacter sp.]